MDVTEDKCSTSHIWGVMKNNFTYLSIGLWGNLISKYDRVTLRLWSQLHYLWSSLEALLIDRIQQCNGISITRFNYKNPELSPCWHSPWLFSHLPWWTHGEETATSQFRAYAPRPTSFEELSPRTVWVSIEEDSSPVEPSFGTVVSVNP